MYWRYTYIYIYIYIYIVQSVYFSLLYSQIAKEKTKASRPDGSRHSPNLICPSISSCTQFFVFITMLFVFILATEHIWPSVQHCGNLLCLHFLLTKPNVLALSLRQPMCMDTDSLITFVSNGIRNGTLWHIYNDILSKLVSWNNIKVT